MGFFTSDSIFEEPLVDTLEKMLSSYAQPLVDVAKEAVNHPSESAETAITTILQFAIDHPYTTLFGSLGTLILLQMYRKNSFNLGLGSIKVEVDTPLFGGALGFHIGRDNSRPAVVERRLRALGDSVTWVFTTMQATNRRLDNLELLMDNVSMKTSELHQAYTDTKPRSSL